jgi:hypothetical protein
LDAEVVKFIVLLALIFSGMTVRLAKDLDISKDVLLTSTSKRNAGQNNEKEIGSGWQGVVNGISITF